MKNLINNLIIRKHHLICDDYDLVRVFNAINKHQSKTHQLKITVRNCNWDKGNNKWLISFDISDTKWNSIIRELEVIRIWDIRDIPINTKGSIYSKD